MPRQASPWYRSQTDSWYVERDGIQYNLGKHPEGAPPPRRGKSGWNAPPSVLTAFHKLMAAGPVLPKPEVVLVCQVCDLFLEHISPFLGDRPPRPAERRKREKQTGEKEPDPPLKENRVCEPRTFWWYDSYLQNFCKHCGTLKVAEVKTLHVTRWLDAHPEWKAGRRCAITAVKRAFNWAVEQGVIPASPMKGVKKPADRLSRTRAAFVSPPTGHGSGNHRRCRSRSVTPQGNRMCLRGGTDAGGVRSMRPDSTHARKSDSRIGYLPFFPFPD